MWRRSWTTLRRLLGREVASNGRSKIDVWFRVRYAVRSMVCGTRAYVFPMKTLLLDLCMMRKIVHFKCGSASFL